MSERFLRLADVRHRVPYSRATIYEKMSKGEFPRSINLGGRAVAWRESDIDAWMAKRVEESGYGELRGADGI
jgi:prophage regulatory protein